MQHKSMTREEKLAYSRGYNRAAKWPLHKPPYPPQEIVAELMAAMCDMRDTADGILAGMGGDPDMEALFGPLIDRCDAAMERVGEWIKKHGDD